MEDLETQYSELISGCGALPLSQWTTLKVIGADRAKFLHNLSTNDINRMKSGDGCEAFLADVKGKIVAHVIVLVREDSLVLLSVPEQCDQIVTHLEKYIIREDVQILDTTPQVQWSMLVGAKSKESVVDVLSVDTGHLLDPWQHTAIESLAEECLIVNADRLGIGCFLIRTPREKVLPQIPVVDAPEIWNALRVENGYPLYGTDVTNAHLPQEVNRDDQAISFNKGCYLGQETVARIDALGHVNKVLRTIKFSGAEVPGLGTSLQCEGKEVGKVTSSCWSPRLKAPLAMAMLQRGSNDLGTELESPVGSAVVFA